MSARHIFVGALRQAAIQPLVMAAALGLIIILQGCGGTSSPAPAPTPTATPIADTISFLPAAPSLDNPTTPGQSTSPAHVTFNVVAYNAAGAVISPSPNNPLYVQLYGVPGGVISPGLLTISSGSTATFNYNGGFLLNNVTVEAWIYDPAAGIPAGEPGAVKGGYAIGVTQLIAQNPLTCSYGTQSSTLNALDLPPLQYVINEAVGYADPAQAANNYQPYTIDTGSLGLLMPLAELPTPVPTPTAGGPVIGPGPAGQQYYDSSGNAFSGYYYLAPVTFQTTNGAVQTFPIEVLAVNKGFCMGAATLPCWKNPPAPTLRYMGVGFNREGLVAGSLFNSPAQNAFLNLTDANGGADISQGYILSKTEPAVTLGITAANAGRFSSGLVKLGPSLTTPGEWDYIHGCFAFPNLSGAPQFCGQMLLDVGIDQMYLGVTSSQVPPAAAITLSDGYTYVPQGTEMTVTAGNQGSNPAMSYSFSMPYTGPQNPPPAPAAGMPPFAQWVPPPAPPPPNPLFFNTGITPLTLFDYMYEAQCGEVGFAPNP